MRNLIRLAMQMLFNNLPKHQGFSTPDNACGSSYAINSIEVDSISIRTKGCSIVNISIDAFIQAVFFLISNNHNVSNKIEIASSNSPSHAGPLCVATRGANNNVRCINYILPILKSIGIVDIDGTQPNKCWYT